MESFIYNLCLFLNDEDIRHIKHYFPHLKLPLHKLVLPDKIKSKHFHYREITDYEGEMKDIPSYVKKISLADEYSKPVCNVPGHIYNLKIYLDFIKVIDIHSINTLEIFDIDSSVDIKIGKVRKLTLHFRENFRFNFPKSMEELHIYGEYYNTLELMDYKNLKVLEVYGKYQNSLDYLPDSLEVLNVMNTFNSKISRYPDNLKTLIFKGFINVKSKNLFCPGVLCPFTIDLISVILNIAFGPDSYLQIN